MFWQIVFCLVMLGLGVIGLVWLIRDRSRFAREERRYAEYQASMTAKLEEAMKEGREDRDDGSERCRG